MEYTLPQEIKETSIKKSTYLEQLGIGPGTFWHGIAKYTRRSDREGSKACRYIMHTIIML